MTLNAALIGSVASKPLELSAAFGDQCPVNIS